MDETCLQMFALCSSAALIHVCTTQIERATSRSSHGLEAGMRRTLSEEEFRMGCSITELAQLGLVILQEFARHWLYIPASG